MPLARYFLFMGGALLALLLVVGTYLPSLPVADRGDPQRARIRIHSEMKLPERVVFDTDAPPIALPATPVIAEADTPTPTPTNDVSAQARQAFAQIQSPDLNGAKVAEPKRHEYKASRPRKSETRKHAAAPRRIRLARQPYFDWYGGGMWW